MKDKRKNLEKMLEYIDKIATSTKGLDYITFSNNDEKVMVVSFCISQIAEYASRFTDEERNEYPTIPFREIRATRNIIVHNYERLNIDLIWNIITNDLPPLATELEKILSLSNF